MEIFTIMLVLLLICFLIGAIVLFIFRLVFKKSKTNLKNPYIHACLIKKANDKAYQEYTEWLGKTGEQKEISKKE